MTARAATTADLSALHALIERGYRGDAARSGWSHEADLIGGQRTDRASLMAQMARPGTTFLLGEDGGVLTGCVLVELRPGAPAYLGMLTVDPRVQRGGLGSALVAAAEAHAATRGATAMTMRVIVQRAELIDWYARRGYTDTGGREPFPYGDPRVGEPLRDDLAFAILEKPLR